MSDPAVTLGVADSRDSKRQQTGRRDCVTRRWLAVLLATAFALPGSPATAQTYRPGADQFRSLTPVPRPVARGEERGLRVGEMRFHPGLSLGSGYNSNVFYEEGDEGVEPVPVFHIMPSLRLETPDPRGLRVSANAQLLWEAYVSDQDDIRNQNGIDVLGDVGVQISPRGLFSVTLYDVIRHYTDSPNTPSAETRRHLYNEVGTLVAFHPGGYERASRRGFTGEVALAYAIETWERDVDLDRALFLTDLELKYYFFPKTALVLQASYDILTYDTRTRTFANPSGSPIIEGFEGALINIDSRPLRVVGGLSGLVSRALELRLLAGWGWGNYSEGADYNGFVAQAELGIFLTSDTRLTVGYKRDFFDSSFGNYYDYDRAYAALTANVGSDWFVGVDASFENRRFATVDIPTLALGGSLVPLYNASDRVDPVLSGTLFASWNYFDWARLTTYYNLRANLTDFVVTTGASSGPGRPNSASSQYIKHEVFLVTEFEY